MIRWCYDPIWRLALVWVLPSRLGFWFHGLISFLILVLDVQEEINNLLKTSRYIELVIVRGQLGDPKHF